MTVNVSLEEVKRVAELAHLELTEGETQGMIRPQQKRQKQWQQMLGSIKTGDKVTTAGGIRGIILSIKDDAIIIRVAPDNLKIEVAKSAIASVTTQEESGS